MRHGSSVARLVVAQAADARRPSTGSDERPARVSIAQTRDAVCRNHATFVPVPPELVERRISGRSLSLERAADLALRVLDEELAAASAAEVREGGSAAGIADTPRRQGP